jgi:hypothetical protein
MDEPEDAAAEAFEALRAEVAQLRADLALLNLAPTAPAADYAPTLGAMAKSLAAIEEHPALKLTPASIAAQLHHAAERAQQQGGRELANAVQRVDAAAAEMKGLVAGHRTARQQNQWLALAGGAGVLFGIIAWVCLSGPIVRTLPTSWHVPERMAAATLKMDRWAAGGMLMQTADPAAWDQVVAASKLERDNHDKLEACRRAVVKAGKPQTCSVILNAGM